MNQHRSLFLSFLAVFVLLSLTAPDGSAAKETTASSAARTTRINCITKGWPHDQSDLKPDPSLIYGTLKNGVRYVIMPNHEPKNRVAMYLNVQAGSIYETEEQNGLAHYLEHMMFNGTTHYPPGTLVEYFQSIGMQFGGDTNAHTSYDETVYKLLLPRGDRKTLNDGMQVLADYATGALLLEEEVDRERGIIQAEKRTRDSASRRVRKKRMESSYAGTMVARRDIIGTDEVLRDADAALLRRYYERWYRPDNIIVVVAGDADTGLVAEVINQYFNGLRAATDAPDCPEFGQLAESGTEAVHLFEKDLGYTGVSIESVWNVEPPRPTRAEALLDLRKYAAVVMMDNRLRQLVNREGSPMTRANVYHGRMVRRLGYTAMTARTSADGWRQTLELLNTSLRQAVRFGFTEPELARAKSEILTQLKKEAQVADSRKSDGLARKIIRNLNDGEVMLSPAQELALFSPALEKMTLAEANKTFVGLWHQRRLVSVMGTADLKGKENGVAPEAVILKTLDTAEKVAVKPWIQEKEAVFPYLPVPEHKAEVAQHIVYKEIEADRHVFNNGLILNLKQTDFEPNELRVTVALGDGVLSEPQPGLALLAEMLLPESGVGGLNKDQLEAVLAPYSSSVRFQVEEGSFQFQGKGLNSESELLFQLLHTHINDPAFRADAFQRGMRRMRQAYARMERSVEGMMHLKGRRFLAGGNLRYGAVPLDMLNKVTLAEIERWLRPILKNQRLEISVVGDFDRDEILRLVGRYFGGQSRDGVPSAKGERIAFPSGKALSLPVTTDSEKGLITVVWPTEDYWDISRTRRLGVLASVLDDRLRKQIREELGAVYSSYAYNRSSLIDPGYGVLQSGAVVDPAQAGLLTDKLKQAGARLAAGKVTAEELERALEPILTSIRDTVRTNGYWLGSVLVGSSRHPQRLEWPLTFLSDFTVITAEEISALAAKYLRPDKAAEVMLLPEKEKKEKKEKK
jgi:zinc protease